MNAVEHQSESESAHAELGAARRRVAEQAHPARFLYDRVRASLSN
jgi:hypothetical protein